MLYVEPCVPNSWKEYEVEYRYLNTIYKISVKITGEKKIAIDNVPDSGNSFQKKALLKK